jgi:hypothetical protein
METDSFNDTIKEVEAVMDLGCLRDQRMITVNSMDMYAFIDDYHRDILMESATVNTKYKTINKKIKPAAIPLPEDSWRMMKEVAKDSSLRDPEEIGHIFTKETKEKLLVGKENFLLPEQERAFRGMLKQHGKAFSFFAQEIGCADPTRMIEPMVIFMVPHIHWNLKPIPIPKAHLLKLIELLKEKVAMRIQEPSNALYSNRWFMVPTKNRSLRFIQDLQPVNKVMIQNAGIRPSVDKFAEEFAGPIHILDWRSLFGIRPISIDGQES